MLIENAPTRAIRPDFDQVITKQIVDASGIALGDHSVAREFPFLFELLACTCHALRSVLCFPLSI
jgi:hypothetical protein